MIETPPGPKCPCAASIADFADVNASDDRSIGRSSPGRDVQCQCPDPGGSWKTSTSMSAIRSPCW